MTKQSSIQSRQERLQILQIRCDLEREHLIRQAQEFKSACAVIDAVGEMIMKVKRNPFLIATIAASTFLFKSRQIGKYLRIGLRFYKFFRQ